MAKGNPQKQMGAAQISENRKGGEPQPKSSSTSRSRLPAPTQLPERRPSPPPPLSARPAAPGGGGSSVATPRSSQLRLPTPSSAAGADPTPRNFSRTASTVQGGPPPRAARPQRCDGSQAAQGGPNSSSSYRDALVTPRASGSSLPAPPLTAQRQADAEASAAGSDSAPQRAPLAGLQQGRGTQQALAARQEDSRLLGQLQARTSHEEERLKQQISRLEAGLTSQQQQLQSRLAAVQMLSERREAVAQQLAALQQLCMQAQAVEEGRRAEVQHLGLAADAVRLALEQHRAQQGASDARQAAARSMLLHMMQGGAHALRLPALAASLQLELAGHAPTAVPLAAAGTAGGGRGTPAPAAQQDTTLHEPAASATAGVPAAASATKPAAQQQQRRQQQQLRSQAPRPASPAGSLHGTPTSSCSEWVDSDSCSSCSSPQAEPEAGAGGDCEAGVQQGMCAATAAAAQQHGPPLPPLQLAGLAPVNAAGEGAGGRSMRRPLSSRILGASLLSPLPAPAATPRAASVGGGSCESGCSLSPEVLRRLHSIQSKLDAALADQALEVEPSA